MQSLWMLLAAFLFATMGVCVKFATQYVHSFEVVMYRGLIGVLVLAWWYRKKGWGLLSNRRARHASMAQCRGRHLPVLLVLRHL